MVDPIPRDNIIRDPENYEDMIRKLEDREKEALERAKLGEDPLKQAKTELEKLRDRRDFKPLSATEKETKLDPADPHVLEVRNQVTALSKRIDTAIKQDPQANRAVLKGRVTLGEPEKSKFAGSSSDPKKS